MDRNPGIKKVLLAACVAVGLAAFSAVVWPTRYRTESGALSGQPVTLRIDRLNGRVEYLSRGGWRVVTPEAAAMSQAQPGQVPTCTADQMRDYNSDPYMHLICDPPKEH